MAEKAPDSLWKARTVEETQALYAEWAATYEDDVAAMGYATPGRIAEALARFTTDKTAPLLDFGCGTGVSGLALGAAGFTTVDGTDISPEMLAQAGDKGAYRRLWVSEPGSLGQAAAGTYSMITAIGVISYGAAPPETLPLLLSFLAPGGLLAFSYNDATFDDPGYLAQVETAIRSKKARLLWREHGPHLPAKDMESSVFVLQAM